MNNLRAYPIYLGIRGSFAFFFTLWASASAGSVIGAVGNIFGVRPALTVAALVLSPTILLYLHTMKSGGVDPEAKGAKRVE